MNYNTIYHGDCLEIIKSFTDNSIDVVFTDPPYFLDKLDNKWNASKVADKKYHHVITSLPAGMKFDREQGRKFYEWYLGFSQQIFRILKPGGTFFSFSSPRLYHRMVSAMDDAGFEIRDNYIWLYTQNQMKAMGMNHVINRLQISDEKKDELKKLYSGWKTPQMKSCFEPIGVGIKPIDSAYFYNMETYQIGLYNTNVRIGENMSPANVMTTESIGPDVDRVFLIPKPTKSEKGSFNTHKTVKPVKICEYLLSLTMFNSGSVVLDPFLGSGTTAIAAQNLGFNWIGIERNQEYIDIAKQRLNQL